MAQGAVDTQWDLKVLNEIVIRHNLLPRGGLPPGLQARGNVVPFCAGVLHVFEDRLAAAEEEADE